MTKNYLFSKNNSNASYAISNYKSKGRRFKEPSHPFRTDFQRDISRIIHCRPFRRLEYKTQVFLNGTGDHYRTRLTHTIEVSATARTIARTLDLNEDLTEAISLAHDLGHTPFGHTGETELNRLLNKYDLQFDHNSHSLKVVDELIEKYPNYNGLNLTWETRSGLLKHRVPGLKLDNVILSPNLSLEAQAADLADDLTYYGHDIDDGLDSKLICRKELEQLSLWNKVADKVSSQNISYNSECYVPYTIRCLIDLMVTDVINHSRKMLSALKIKTPQDAQSIPEKAIDFSPGLKSETNELKDFLYKRLYNNDSVSKIKAKTKKVITELFYLYIKRPEYMGSSALSRLKKDNTHIIAADYIAGMTDRFAFDEYNNHFNKIKQNTGK